MVGPLKTSALLAVFFRIISFMPQDASGKNFNLEAKALIVLGCAVFYTYAFNLNVYFFDHFAFSRFVNWVFIPSGLQLLFVLVFLELGAMGVVAGSVFIQYTNTPDEHLFNIVTSIVSGGSPLLAQAIAKRLFGFDVTLTGFNAQLLLKVSVLFALVSPVLHQIWYLFVGRTEHLVMDTVVMAIGDWFGTVLVLATAAWTLKFFRFLAKSNSDKRPE